MWRSVLFLVGLGCRPPAPAVAEAELGLDPSVRRGVLDNGFRWYVAPHGEPQDRVVFRLAVGVGSLAEDPDQLGLAHFVEHMAFNGTEHFPGNELVSWFEANGLRFGAHLNAHTGFEETVYKLEVPTDDPAVVDQALTVVRDWAYGLRFDPEEIEKERGVVLEEWRTRLNANTRIFEQLMPSTYGSARYVERLPIGTEASLRGFEPEALVRFYRDWYRPENMALVVVGDLDVDALITKLPEHFQVPFAGEPRPVPVEPLPDLVGRQVVVATDPELRQPGLRWMQRFDDPQDNRRAGYRELLLRNLALGVFNARMSELGRDPGEPFLGAGLGYSRLSPTEGAISFGATPRQGQEGLALRRMAEEVARWRRHGVHPLEVQRELDRGLSRMEQAWKEREQRPSVERADELVRHALQGEPAPGLDVELALYQQFRGEVQPSEVAAWLDRFFQGADLVQGWFPTGAGQTPPDQAALLAELEAGLATDRGPWPVVEQDRPLVAELPGPGAVVERREDPDLGTTTWRLANGVTVVFKPTDFKADEVLLAASSPGGLAAEPLELLVPARTATSLRARSGLGEWEAAALEQRLAGRTVSLSPWISRFYEGFQGSSSVEDLETLFELLWLAVSAPRFDPPALLRERQGLEEGLRNRAADPSAVFSERLTEVLWQGHPRMLPWREQDLDQLDLAASAAVWERRFRNDGAWTFVLTGNLDLAAVEPLLLRTVGAWPQQGEPEPLLDDGARRVAGPLEEVVRVGADPRATVNLSWQTPYVGGTGAEAWMSRSALYALSDVLAVRLREQLREERGGVYGVSVRADHQEWPAPTAELTISFVCDPERVDELVATVEREVASRQRSPLDAHYVEDEKLSNRRQREQSVRENSFWSSSLATALRNGWDPRDLLTWDQRNDALTPELLQETAQAHLPLQVMVKAVHLPGTP